MTIAGAGAGAAAQTLAGMNGTGNNKAMFQGWRSPATQETPLVQPGSLPDHEIKGEISVNVVEKDDSGSNTPSDQSTSNTNTTRSSANTTSSDYHHHNSTSNNNNKQNLHPSLQCPSFQQPCEHSADGEMHSHAVDLLGFATSSPPPRPAPDLAGASVPTHAGAGYSFLHAPRPPSAGTSNNGNGSGASGSSQPPKASRRMSSSTSQSRGKSGFLGIGAQGPVPAKDGRPAGMTHASSYAGPSPGNSRRLSTSNGSATGSGPGPQLYDFSKSDRPRPGASGPAPAMNARTVSTPAGGVAASLPVRSVLQERLGRPQEQAPGWEMELDMQFGGSDDDDRDRGRRSGSDDIEMDFEETLATPEVVVAPLGSGSGGIKGRRKGVEFKCEHCAKVYLHPNCLSKHRWEHSPHWREPTAANMSKHQQVQQLEAAAILTFGASLPEDRSLWPSHMSNHERATRSPQVHPRASFSSHTSSVPRQPSSLGTMGERMGQPRKQSPGSDSTTSSNGVGDSGHLPTSNMHHQVSNGNGQAPGYGMRAAQPTPSPSRPTAYLHPAHPGMGQRAPSHGRRASRTPSFSNSPGHPSSLPDMTGLHFHSGAAGIQSNSPIPNRGGIPLSLQSRAGMIGGGMFGAGVHSTVRSSSVRSGAADDLPEEDDDYDEAEDGYEADDPRAKSSSEEADERRRTREGEEYGMAEEMEL